MGVAVAEVWCGDQGLRKEVHIDFPQSLSGEGRPYLETTTLELCCLFSFNRHFACLLPVGAGV